MIVDLFKQSNNVLYGLRVNIKGGLPVKHNNFFINEFSAECYKFKQDNTTHSFWCLVFNEIIIVSTELNNDSQNKLY